MFYWKTIQKYWSRRRFLQCSFLKLYKNNVYWWYYAVQHECDASAFKSMYIFCWKLISCFCSLVTVVGMPLFFKGAKNKISSICHFWQHTNQHHCNSNHCSNICIGPKWEYLKAQRLVSGPVHHSYQSHWFGCCKINLRS